jgi:predicted heme/steroid binding protein
MQQFTRDELSKYNGKNGMPNYVAVQGKVYDVTKSGLWEDGEHQGMHTSGRDLSNDIKDAPHEMEVFATFPQVGELVEKK